MKRIMNAFASVALLLGVMVVQQASAQTVGHGATATVLNPTLQGGRADLWKAVRWCVSVKDADHVRVVVQYQKQKHLLCEIVPGGTDICSWFAGTKFAIDNSTKLDDWHTTLSYGLIPLGADDGSGNRTFDRDGVSGTVTTGNALTALTVNKPGRVVFSKASGSTSLTAGGGACR